MKVFVASISTETNTFAPAPTSLAAFDIESYATLQEVPEGNIWRRTLTELCEQGGHTVALGDFAFAQPSGPTVRTAYETLRDSLLISLRRSLPVDAVVLPLHGAMVADGYPDCEGDIIQHVRQIVGPNVPIGVELDLHCHYTEAMRQHADVIVAYKEYPHTDVLDRFVDTWHLTLATARGEVRPVSEVVDCRMVSFWHTTREPMTSFVRTMQALEKQPGVLSVSFGQGFPYGDVTEAGAKIWVITDNDRPLAARLAEQLRQTIWDIRHETRPQEWALDAALDHIQDHAPNVKPLLIADIADNPGGGAACDSTFILAGLLNRDLGNVAIGPIWDLGAIAICREAGEGARIALRLGGKCGPTSGSPVDLMVTVQRIVPDHIQEVPGIYSSSCGESVWLRTDAGIDLALISKRQQAYARSLFTGLGIALENQRAIVVKSTQHFFAEFSPLASEVLYVNTPGLLRTDFENIEYHLRDSHVWPRVDNPFESSTE